MGSYAGVDWAADKHDVRVADDRGEQLLAATFAHDEKGLRALCRTLVRLKVALVAIERPDGVLVERLVDAGRGVLAMHPNQVAASRAAAGSAAAWARLWRARRRGRALGSRRSGRARA